MKKNLLPFLILLSSNSYGQDTDGFFVIPVIVEKVVVKEVCTGTEIGGEIFTITETGKFINVGNTYLTSQNRLIEITGVKTASGVFINFKSATFRVAPSTLPSPDNGIKGPFFSTVLGSTVYARFL
jgi:hypothetical protein